MSSPKTRRKLGDDLRSHREPWNRAPLLAPSGAQCLVQSATPPPCLKGDGGDGKTGENDPLGGCKHRQLGKVIGISNRARQRRQHVRIAMVDTETGEFTEKTLGHAGDAVRGFYAALEGPVVVGIEAIG